MAVSVSAQVSNIEGLTPLEGVVIPNPVQIQAVKPGTVFKDCDECPEMVVIPAGSFLMGSPNHTDPYSEDGYPAAERPQHSVNIQSFAIGKYEVTQEQWFAVMGSNPSKRKGRSLPVEYVSWDDAQFFVEKLSQKIGKKYRLPSEAEWEYAARAGTTTQYFWGDDANQADDYAWFFHNSEIETKGVGLKKPNQFGLYDMIGNAQEWVQDCWSDNYIKAPLDGSAWMNQDCDKHRFNEKHITRGGDYFSGEKNLRSAFREKQYNSPDFRTGFRVAIHTETTLFKNEILNPDLTKNSEETIPFLNQIQETANNNSDKNIEDLIPLSKFDLYQDKESETSILLPELLDNLPLVYPRMSAKLGEQGIVFVKVFISLTGEPLKVELHTSSGFERLDKSGMEAAMRWRYTPGKRDGVAVPMWFVMPITFNLKKEQNEKPNLLFKLFNIFK